MADNNLLEMHIFSLFFLTYLYQFTSSLSILSALLSHPDNRMLSISILQLLHPISCLISQTSPVFTASKKEHDPNTPL